MPTEKELMLKQADAETTYQKKLTAGTNITIDPVTNVISSAGGGSTVQYTDNTSNGESVGILAINGQSHPIRIPRLAEGSGITITKNITTNVYTISLSGGGGGTTKTYMGETNPDELVGEDGDLYFKYHKIETDIPTELTLPSLPDDATVPFPITNFSSYDSFTFYYYDGNRELQNKKVNIRDLVISDSPADEYPNSSIYTLNSYHYVEATRSTNGEGLVLRVCGNCLYKLEANVTEVDLGIDKSYAKVEDTWLPSGEQVEANPEETSQTPLTKIKIDGVTYYIAAGGSAEIVPLTRAEWDALPASKYTDDILYLITDSFTTDTIITPNPEGEATDTLTKLQIDETIYSLAGESGAAAIEKTQSEYNELTPAQKENGAIYMVQDDGGIGNYEYHTNQAETIVVRVNKTTDEIEWFFVDYTFTGGSVEQIPSELMAYLPASTISGNAYDTSLQTMMGYVAINAQGGFGLYPTDYSREIAGTVKCLLKNTDGTEQANTYTDPYEGTGDAVNKIYFMGTEYANTNGGSGGGGDGYKIEKIFDGNVTTSGNITLTKSLNNYDELVFITNFTRELGESYISSFNVDVSIFKNIGSYTATRGVLLNDWSKDTRFAQVKYVDDTTIDVESIQVISIVEIYGVKHSSGGGGGTSEGEGVEIYSENEYIVGKWIDGKKLYQKSIKFSATSLSTNWMTIEQGVDYNLAFPEVQGLYYTSSGEPFTQSTRVFVQNGELKIQPLNELDLLSSTLKHVITIRYTKTVETPAPAWGGSVTNNYANFIDTDNVIVPSTTWTGSMSYTATEDCYIILENDVQNGHFKVTIDGVEVYDCGTSGQYMSIKQPFAIKKGQILEATSNQSNTLHYTVYGISYGSGGSSSESSVHYSTTEQVIGTWIDGKPLYQKTYENLNIGTVQNYTLTLSDLQNIEYFRVVPEGSQISAIVPFPYIHYGTQNLVGYFTDITNGVPSLEIRKGSEAASFSTNLQFLTIQYTKTTD